MLQMVQIPPPAPLQSVSTPLSGVRLERWNRLSADTLEDYGDALTRLALEVRDLDNVILLGRVISGLKGHRLESSRRIGFIVGFTVRREHKRQLPRISAVIAEGWEKAFQTVDKVWFRRPRWVP